MQPKPSPPSQVSFGHTSFTLHGKRWILRGPSMANTVRVEDNNWPDTECKQKGQRKNHCINRWFFFLWNFTVFWHLQILAGKGETASPWGSQFLGDCEELAGSTSFAGVLTPQLFLIWHIRPIFSGPNTHKAKYRQQETTLVAWPRPRCNYSNQAIPNSSLSSLASSMETPNLAWAFPPFPVFYTLIKIKTVYGTGTKTDI